MKTDLNPYSASLPSAHQGVKALTAKNKAAAAGAGAQKEVNMESPDYKLELSDEAKLPVPDLSVSPKAKVEVPQEVKEVKELQNLKKIGLKKKESEQRPLILFIKGLDLFSSPSKSERGYTGVGKMAEAVEGSRIYGWDQQGEILEEISKIHRDFPVVLVGHSLGGDTAMEVADQLDSLEYNFRPVDLLVTIDAVGLDNDIVPQNVKKHLNVFGENNFFLNDGPHVARREEKTLVRNILSPLDHTDIDDDKEMQFEVMTMITEALKKA